MRASLRILTACLTCLPTMAFADVYPLNPPPELFIDNITVETGGFITGDVESITDVGKCAEPTPCNTGPTSVSPLYFYEDPSAGTFQVNDHDGDIYLVGYPLTASQVDSGGEVGQIFTVSRDDTNLWTSAEGQTPSSFGPVVAIDFHDFYPGDVGFQPDATAYIAPLGSTVPEPASLTLLLSGLAAGLARRRMAGKKA
ncbi:MAG: PEP-CTERM sorting domain-containing protein [Terracidiphilus sp.]|jgi:hypothetical protein